MHSRQIWLSDVQSSNLALVGTQKPSNQEEAKDVLNCSESLTSRVFFQFSESIILPIYPHFAEQG